MIKHIFLDLDDVCNQFTMYALQYVGCPVSAMDYAAYKPSWGFDIIKAANVLHPARAFTPKEFWECISRSVWSSAPESPEFRPLLDYCWHAVGPLNICILTTPINDPECLAGKFEWIHEHFPRWMHRQFLMGPPKHLCARPDALLIDDSDKNVIDFRANGGNAILVPRPWNSLSALLGRQLSSIPYLKQALCDYFPQLKWITKVAA